jgi:hypothetical protein
VNPRRRLPDRPIPASEPGRHRTEGVTQVLARPWRRRALPFALGGLMIALLAGIVGWFARPAAPHRPADVQRQSAIPTVSPAPCTWTAGTASTSLLGVFTTPHHLLEYSVRRGVASQPRLASSG